jgi:hypothetical protein
MNCSETQMLDFLKVGHQQGDQMSLVKKEPRM